MDTPNTYEPPAPMTPEQKELLEKENRWRNLFAEKPNDPEIQDPHLGLMNVFQGNFVFEEESPAERAIPKILTQHRQLDLSGPAIVTRDQFVKKWEEFTQGCFKGMNWENVFAAGGAVLGCLATNQDTNRGSDIDLFIHGITNEQMANQKLKEIYNTIIKNTGGRGDVIRTNRAITILCSYPFRHVQIILRLYKSPAEVLLGFDIDSCCVGFDGVEVWCQDRFKRALTKRYNLVNTSRRSLTYEQRLFKYSKRGFAVAVPNLDKNRVNPALFDRDPRDLQGLPKLLIYDFRQNDTGAKKPAFAPRKKTFGRPRDKTGVEEEGSDYNNDLPVPWGPEWQTETILNMLNTKNRAQFFSSVRRQKFTAGAKAEPKVAAPTGSEAEGKKEEEGDKEKKPYNHMFTSNAEKLQASDFAVWKRSLDNKEMQRPIEWIKDNPAYQDYDNGFRRLMTGSFEPVVDGNWEKGVYLSPGEIASPSFLAKKPFSSNTTSIKDAKSSPQHQGLGLAPPSPAASQSVSSLFSAAGVAPSFVFGSSLATTAPGVTTAKTAFSFGGPQPSSPSPKLSKNQEWKLERKKEMPKPKRKIEEEDDEEPSADSLGESESEEEVKKKKTSKAVSFGGGGGGGLDAASFLAAMSAIPSSSSSSSASAGLGYDQPDNLSSFPQPGSLYSSLQSEQPPQPGVSSPWGASPSNVSTAGSSASTASTSSTASTASTAPAVPSIGGHPFMAQQLPPMPGFYGAGYPFPQQIPMSIPSFVPSTATMFGAPPPANPATTRASTKLLLLVALCFKQGTITNEEKGKLKDLVINGNAFLLSALDVFEIDQDLPEFVDTVRRLCRLMSTQ